MRDGRQAIFSGVVMFRDWCRTSVGRTIAMGIVLAAFVAALSAVLLLRSGFCFAQARFLSHAEHFDAAIREIIRGSHYTINTYETGRISAKPVAVDQYQDIAQFHSENPNCCNVVQHNSGDTGPYVTFGQRWFGDAAKTVAVKYLVRYVDDAGQRQSVVATKQYAVTNCGRAWNAVR